jgi:hypothetical protein
LTEVFLIALAFIETFDFVLLRAAAFCAAALFAFGRLGLAAAVRFLVTAFDDERRASAREEERLKLLVTALMGLRFKELCGPSAPQVAVAE